MARKPRDRKAEYQSRNEQARAAGFRNYYQYRKYTEKFRHGLKESNVTRIPRAKRGGETAYQIAGEHKALFGSEPEEKAESQRKRLADLKKWLVDTTGYWTVAQWDERYRSEGE